MSWKHVKLGEQDWQWVPCSHDDEEELIESLSESPDSKYPPCSSNDSCEIVNNFFTQNINEALIFEKIRVTREEIEIKEKLLQDQYEYINQLKEDLEYLNKTVNNYYSEMYPGWNKHK